MIPSLILATILGLILGSFLNVLIPRLHYEEKGILFGRSHCPHCQRPLHALDLIPLFSYFLLKARCRYCQERLSFWYPVVELSSALSLGLLYFHTQDLDLFVWLVPSFFILLFIFFYDLRFKEIHEWVLIPGICFTFLASFFIGNPVGSLTGAAIAFSFFGLQYLLSQGRWLGSGDIQIGVFIGLFLGWPQTLLALMMSYIIGSLISLTLLTTKKFGPKSAVPLGPFLVVGSLLSFFFGDQILELYLKLT